MSLAAITVVVVLAAGEPDGASSPARASMEQALHVALGEDAHVVVEERAPDGDDALIAHAEAEHAAVVGVVTWRDHQRRATMRFAHTADRRWAEREIRFDAADAAAERGRTVGFAIASLFPEELMAARKRSAAAESAPTPAPAPAPAPALAPAPAPAPAPTAEEPRPHRSPDEIVRRVSVEALGMAGAAVGGYGGGVGGAIGVRVPVLAGVQLRGALDARAADVPEAQASSRIFDATAGVAWQTWLDAPQRWFAGARAEAVLQRHELVHLSSDDPAPDHQIRWLPGVGAALELGCRVTEQAALFGAARTEAVLGRSVVVVHHREQATISPVRFLAEAGLRVYF